MKIRRGSRVVPCGRTDRHDEANSPLFAIFAKAPESIQMNYICTEQRTAYYIPVTILTAAVDKAPPQAPRRAWSLNIQNIKICCGIFFGLYSFLTAASIVDPRYEIWA
jgi:hypothetical protein